MFQKATDNTNDTDILARAGHFRPQTTDAADDQIDGHIRARSFVQFLDDLLIDERVQFRDNASRFACPSVVTLPLECTYVRTFGKTVLMAFLMCGSAAVAMLNLVADVAVHAIDPRTRDAA